MSGNYIPFSGNPSAYGQGPQHLFFSGLGQAASPPPAPPPLPSQPFGVDTLGYPGGTSGALGDMPSVSTPSPDQSLAAMGNAARTGLSVASGPFGIATALGSLGLTDYLGRDPSLSLGPMGTLGALGEALGLTSRPDAAVNALYSEAAAAAGANMAAAAAEANAMAQGMQSPTGFGSYGFGTSPNAGLGSGDFSQLNQDARDAAAEAADKTGANALAEATEVGAPPGGVFGDPGTDPGDPGDTGSPSNLAGGGPVMLAGGGLTELPGGGKVAAGPGGGLDDLIPTTINGRRAAALSDGEFVIPADVVSMMGDGSSRAGTQRLYDLVKNVRQDKTGTNKQAGPLEVGAILRRVFK